MRPRLTGFAALALVLGSGCAKPSPTKIPKIPPSPAETAPGADDESEMDVAADLPKPRRCERPPKAVAKDPDFFTLRRRLSQIQRMSGTPGLAMAIAHRGRIVFTGAAGYADREKKLRASAKIPFSVASVTKPFVAVATLMAAQGGFLALDEPLSTYLPEPITAGAGEPGEATVRLALAHRAGLPTHAGFFHGPPPPGAATTISTYAATITVPGELHRYSNLGYGLVGLALEHALGKPLPQILDALIFYPLGLRSASLGAPKKKRHAARYLPGGERLGPYVTDHPGASELYISAADLARFGAAFLGAGTPPFFSMEGRKAMTTPFDPADGYGLGLILGRFDGQPVMSHDGQMWGAGATLQMFPEQDLAVAIVGNASTLNPEFGALVLEVLMALQIESRAEDLCALDDNDPILRTWTGTVRTPSGERAVTLKIDHSGEASLKVGAGPPRKLHLVTYDGSTLEGSGHASVVAPPEGPPDDITLNVNLRGDTLDGALIVHRRLDGTQSLWVSLAP